MPRAFWNAEDALPHESAVTRPQSERADLRGPAAVRDHHVGRRSRQQSPKPPATPNHRDEADRRRVHERWQPRFDAAVECERERDQLILVPERVELVCELDRHDLGAAAMRSRDHLHDAHRFIVPRSWNRSVQPGSDRSLPSRRNDDAVRNRRGHLRPADHHRRPARTRRGLDQHEWMGGGGGAGARTSMGGHTTTAWSMSTPCARRRLGRRHRRRRGRPLRSRAAAPCFVRCRCRSPPR